MQGSGVLCQNIKVPLFVPAMASIVTHVHRYKRPPRRRKAVALEVPAIVTAKKSRRPEHQAAAKSKEVHTQCSTTGERQRDPAVTAAEKALPGNDDRKPAIVTARRPGKHYMTRRSTSGEATLQQRCGASGCVGDRQGTVVTEGDGKGHSQ